MRITNRKIFVSALFLTVVIFVMGLLLGLVIEGKRVEFIEQADREQKINLESLQLQLLYLSSIEGRESCPAFTTALSDHIKETENTRERLEKYLTEDMAHESGFSLLKREYIISQLNYWVLARKTRDICESDFVSVLYFYSKKCPDCENQGFILDYLKKLFGDRLLIFALDKEFADENMIKVIAASYNVSWVPTIVIEDKVYQGFQSKDQLLKLVCSEYSDKPSDCP